MQTYKNSSIPIVHVWSIQTHHYCSCSAKSYSFLCFLIPWTINNRSIIIDNDKKRSRTHACICFLFLFFQLYTCHLPYVLTYSSISFINSRFRKKTKKELSSMHHIKYSVYSRARRLLNDLQWAKEESSTSIYLSECIYNLFRVLIGLILSFCLSYINFNWVCCLWREEKTSCLNDTHTIWRH
jgi:hypothetical protein